MAELRWLVLARYHQLTCSSPKEWGGAVTATPTSGHRKELSTLGVFFVTGQVKQSSPQLTSKGRSNTWYAHAFQPDARHRVYSPRDTRCTKYLLFISEIPISGLTGSLVEVQSNLLCVSQFVPQSSWRSEDYRGGSKITSIRKRYSTHHC